MRNPRKANKDTSCFSSKIRRTIESVPSEVKGVVTEVTDEFSSGDVLHDSKLQETNEGNNLGNSGSRDGVEGGETVRDIGERKSRVVNVSGQSDTCGIMSREA